MKLTTFVSQFGFFIFAFTSFVTMADICSFLTTLLHVLLSVFDAVHWGDRCGDSSGCFLVPFQYYLMMNMLGCVATRRRMYSQVLRSMEDITAVLLVCLGIAQGIEGPFVRSFGRLLACRVVDWDM